MVLIGWDGTGWDRVGWDGMGCDAIGWDRVLLNSDYDSLPIAGFDRETGRFRNQTAELEKLLGSW